MERAQLREYLGTLGCAAERGPFVFLCDPHWSETERTAAAALLAQADAWPASDPVAEGWLCIRTGGSGGGLKFARHDERTLTAAVEGFRGYFGLERINTVGVLPPWHVSGLMARVRCVATGGEYLGCEWKALEAGRLPPLAPARDWVISIVPTQLQRLLASTAGTQWLRGFKVVLLGGGPTWRELADAAAAAGVRASLSYGMTETAAMVAAQHPEEFLAGDRSSGAAMPHARLGIDRDGRVAISGDSVFRGYFPEFRREREFVTEDLGRLDEAGRLHVLGRRDAVIITGGKKVQPAEVEAALRASGEFEDVIVVGVPDPEWGECVVACHPAGARAPDAAKAVRALAPHQRPKRFVALAEWPRNAQGKINRAAITAAIMQLDR